MIITRNHNIIEVVRNIFINYTETFNAGFMYVGLKSFVGFCLLIARLYTIMIIALKLIKNFVIVMY